MPNSVPLWFASQNADKITEVNGIMAHFEFRRALRKLVAFFKASRDKWKEKCQQAKYELKLLKRRFENLQISRDQLQRDYQVA